MGMWELGQEEEKRQAFGVLIEFHKNPPLQLCLVQQNGDAGFELNSLSIFCFGFLQTQLCFFGFVMFFLQALILDKSDRLTFLFFSNHTNRTSEERLQGVFYSSKSSFFLHLHLKYKFTCN